jgi:beta-phosphoglucomutase-like phosphatase (HAD superfamily)
VAVEDSDPGVTSALAAGMAVIMINATPPADATYPENVTVVASHHHVEEMFFADDPPYVTNSP